jgi:DNA-binding CsgD family transcriptional regulator
MVTPARRYELIGKIAVADKIADAMPPLIEFATTEFAPQSVIVLVYRDGHQPVSIIRWIPDDPLRQTFDEDYFNLGYLLDPFALKAAAEPFMSAHRIFEIAPDRFESSEYFARYYRKTGMVDELGALFRIDDTTVAHLSLGRNAGYPKFTARESRKFKMLSAALMPKIAQLAAVDIAQHIAADFTQQGTGSSASNLAELFRDLHMDKKRRLSGREAEIAALITQGHSSRSISINLGISIHTVKVHRRNIYKKLAISAQNELFGLAMRASDQNKERQFVYADRNVASRGRTIC